MADETEGRAADGVVEADADGVAVATTLDVAVEGVAATVNPGVADGVAVVAAASPLGGGAPASTSSEMNLQVRRKSPPHCCSRYSASPGSSPWNEWVSWDTNADRPCR